MQPKEKISNYSSQILCEQLHLLYKQLQERKKQILADPEFDPGNDALNNELEEIHYKLKLLQECFENFCPS